MAIHKGELSTLLNGIDELFSQVMPFFPKIVVESCRDKLLGPALKELKEMTDNPRPPVFFFIGRSGAGKSSLLNALAGKEIAPPSDIKPGTGPAKAYTLEMRNGESWIFVDSRGLSDATRPDGAQPVEAVVQLKNDLEKHKPDFILHVIPAREVRNAGDELKAVAGILQTVLGKERSKSAAMILSQPDLLGKRSEWPPASYPGALKEIADVVKYASQEVLKGKTEPLYKDRANSECFGVTVNDAMYRSVIPVASPKGEPSWNIDALRIVIQDAIPPEAQLSFAQGMEQKDLLKRLANRQVTIFSAAASGIGLSPIPVADILILTPLQIIMVAVIAGLSCRQISQAAAMEYFTAAGVNVGAAFLLRSLAQTLLKLWPGPGNVVSAGIASAGTAAIGWSAVQYYFLGKVVDPSACKEPPAV